MCAEGVRELRRALLFVLNMTDHVLGAATPIFAGGRCECPAPGRQ